MFFLWLHEAILGPLFCGEVGGSIMVLGGGTIERDGSNPNSATYRLSDLRKVILLLYSFVPVQNRDSIDSLL